MNAKLAPALLVSFLAVQTFAQQPATPAPQPSSDSAMEQRMRELEDRVIALEGQIRMLKAAQAQPAPGAQPM